MSNTPAEAIRGLDLTAAVHIEGCERGLITEEEAARVLGCISCLASIDKAFRGVIGVEPEGVATCTGVAPERVAAIFRLLGSPRFHDEHDPVIELSADTGGETPVVIGLSEPVQNLDRPDHCAQDLARGQQVLPLDV